MSSDSKAEISQEDRRFIRRALTIAARSRTHPNPMVGAVIVRDGQIVGEGWHKGYINGVATAHAEAMAFEAAGERATGATVYVNLEPCAHWVRSDGTPRLPCSQRCINARVARVVCAMEDPDPRVQGRGFAALRAAGIEVVVGVEEAKARELNRAYIRERTTGLPYILHKAAMSLDGKIAPPPGIPADPENPIHWITGDDSRAYVHRLRHQADAVVVGIGTILADNPQLTTRLPGGRNGHDPVRVLLDSRLRLPGDAKITRPGTVVLTGEGADTTRRAELEACGVEVVTLPTDKDGRPDVTAAARWLAERGLFSVLLESGGALAAAFWEARLVNRALFFIAPRIIGGAGAPTPIDGTGLAQNRPNAVHLGRLRFRRFGRDVALEAEVNF